MARINYREVTDRFTHIDARFVACEIGLPGNDGFFTVDLYPWWEHPLYLEARSEGARWGFDDTCAGYRPVTVYPQSVYQFRLSRTTEVTDWDFTQEHPLLWQYEDAGQIICESPVSLEQWARLSDSVRGKLLGYNHSAELAEYVSLQTIHQWGRTGSFSLGHFPRTLFRAIREVLEEQEVQYFAGADPEPVELPVLFLIDGGDYVIAQDFEVDVPEFEHRPEWFRPG